MFFFPLFLCLCSEHGRPVYLMYKEYAILFTFICGMLVKCYLFNYVSSLSSERGSVQVSWQLAGGSAVAVDQGVCMCLSWHLVWAFHHMVTGFWERVSWEQASHHRRQKLLVLLQSGLKLAQVSKGPPICEKGNRSWRFFTSLISPNHHS